MYGLSAGTKKSGRCGEAAVSGGSTVHHIISCHVISFHLLLNIYGNRRPLERIYLQEP